MKAVDEIADDVIGLALNSSLLKDGFIQGYNYSQETHPFTEKDMIDFVVWYETSEFTYRYWKNKNIYPRMDGSYNEDYREGIQELLMVWKQIQEDPFKY